jgi:hypothetical protein
MAFDKAARGCHGYSRPAARAFDLKPRPAAQRTAGEAREQLLAARTPY